MKRGTPEHPKVGRLAKMLNIRRCTAVGLLEMLWHLTARYTPRGDVGKWSDEEIATALDWDGVPERLTHALVACGLLEEHPEHRLIVHDWPDHADEAVRLLLKRRQLTFVSRHVPTCSDISPRSATISLLPEPLPEPEPKPEPFRENGRSLRSLTSLEGFEEAWEAYGHKESKADAQKAWQQTAGSRPGQPAILEAIARYHQTPKWQEGVRCHFATWLRKKRYLDEPSAGVVDEAAAQLARVRERLERGR